MKHTLTFKTSDLTAALAKMCRDHRHVILSRPKMRGALRLSRDGIGEVATFHHKRWEQTCELVLGAWQQQGGLLIDYTERPSRKQAIASEAMLFEHCPMSMEQLERIAHRVSRTIVVGEPPNFSIQEETALRVAPDPHSIEEVCGFLASRVPSDRETAIAAKFGADPGFAVTTSQDASMATGVELSICSAILVTIGTKIACMTPRFRPDEPGIRELYDRIKEEPATYREERAFLWASMNEMSRNWRKMLRVANAHGFIEKKRDLYLVSAERIETPFLFRAAKLRRSQAEELRVMQGYMKTLSDYLPAIPRRTPASKSPASTSAEEPSAGTAR